MDTAELSALQADVLERYFGSLTGVEKAQIFIHTCDLRLVYAPEEEARVFSELAAFSFEREDVLALSQEMKDELVLQLPEADITVANAAVLSGKLLQMANGAIYNDQKEIKALHDKKLLMLGDLIEQANGQNVLVAYWYQHDHLRIREYLKELGYETRDLNGDADIADWNAGKIQVGLISPASAGHGLNIQKGGHILIWFSLVWSLEMYQQTNARLWRQGQKEVVTIHHIQIGRASCRERV